MSLIALVIFASSFFQVQPKVEQKPIVVISVYPTDGEYYNVEITHPTDMDECEILDIIEQSIKCKVKTHRL